MTIKVSLPVGPISVLAGDTTIFDISSVPAYDRYRVEAANIHNTTAAPVSVTIYYSPDTTSASGTEVCVMSIGAGQNEDVNAIIGQGRDDNIIAVGSATGLRFTMTYVGFGAED